MNRQRVVDYLNGVRRLYVVDGYAGWDPAWRKKFRIICELPYHALFMRNMLVVPTKEEFHEDFKDGAEWNILNAGMFRVDPRVKGTTNDQTSVNLNFKTKELTVLGTLYAGEMKKGVFGIMNYLMPMAGQLSMHCSANEGKKGDVTLFFGLSGTGKTTLSADPERALIGDDEHVNTLNSPLIILIRFGLTTEYSTLKEDATQNAASSQERKNLIFMMLLNSDLLLKTSNTMTTMTEL